MDWNLRLPDRAVGPPLLTIVPSPSWPLKFRPQQNGVPSSARPHVCDPPAASAENLNPPATGAGTNRCVEPLSPNWPDVSAPQQYAVLSLAIAQLCCPPAVTWRQPMLPGRRVGCWLFRTTPLVSTR